MSHQRTAIPGFSRYKVDGQSVFTYYKGKERFMDSVRIPEGIFVWLLSDTKERIKGKLHYVRHAYKLFDVQGSVLAGEKPAPYGRPISMVGYNHLYEGDVSYIRHSGKDIRILSSGYCMTHKSIERIQKMQTEGRLTDDVLRSIDKIRKAFEDYESFRNIDVYDTLGMSKATASKRLHLLVRMGELIQNEDGSFSWE